MAIGWDGAIIVSGRSTILVVSRKDRRSRGSLARLLVGAGPWYGCRGQVLEIHRRPRPAATWCVAEGGKLRTFVRHMDSMPDFSLVHHDT